MGDPRVHTLGDVLRRGRTGNRGPTLGSSLGLGVPLPSTRDAGLAGAVPPPVAAPPDPAREASDPGESWHPAPPEEGELSPLEARIEEVARRDEEDSVAEVSLRGDPISAEPPEPRDEPTDPNDFVDPVGPAEPDGPDDPGGSAEPGGATSEEPEEPGSSPGRGREDLRTSRSYWIPSPPPPSTPEKQREELGLLRRFLQGDQGERIQALEDRFGEPEWLEEALPYHLPRAFQRNPERVSEALYPILGPAIRKAITNALSQTVQRINQTLESSLSWKGMQLRWEAYRTGVSFGELVMRQSLEYRVEQVFLIHRDTGLPILHVVDPDIEAQDGSLVSSMLTAVQDFVQDSFGLEEEDGGLDRLQLGDLELFIEAGPYAVLAAVVRGIPPEDVRNRMIQTLEGIHGTHHESLEAFDGDSEGFEVLEPQLHALLQSRVRSESSGFPRQVLVFWVVLALGLTYLLGSWLISQRRWARFRAIAAEKPGILVTSIERNWESTVVTGLRDPLADPTGDLLEAAGIPPEGVDLQWAAYICLDQEIILRRARQVLQAPDSVRFELYAGRLLAKGYSTPAWRERARKLVGAIPGIQGYDDTSQNYLGAPEAGSDLSP